MLRRITTRRRKRGGTAKQKALAAIRRLPANATLEDVIGSLVFVAKIDRGLADLDSGTGVAHAEARRRLLR
jgi:hypothetical protein